MHCIRLLLYLSPLTPLLTFAPHPSYSPSLVPPPHILAPPPPPLISHPPCPPDRFSLVPPPTLAHPSPFHNISLLPHSSSFCSSSCSSIRQPAPLAALPLNPQLLIVLLPPHSLSPSIRHLINPLLFVVLVLLLLPLFLLCCLLSSSSFCKLPLLLSLLLHLIRFVCSLCLFVHSFIRSLICSFFIH